MRRLKSHRALDHLWWSALPRCAPTLACVSSRRLCAAFPVQQITPASPVLHSTLADAHIHASCLLAEMLHTRQPTSLAAYVQVTREWWRAVEQLVLLPAAAEEIHDLPQYLAELAGVPRQHTNEDNTLEKLHNEAGTLLEKWEEWVWTSVPSTMPTAAAFNETIDEDQGATRSAFGHRDVLSFPLLTSLLYSYSRYHRGVRWGAARPNQRHHGSNSGTNEHAKSGGAAAAAYYRRRYLLHPWHGLCCPEGTAEQMPYVHVLRWMLAGKESSTPPEEVWRQHKALAHFRMPAAAATDAPFRALDVCSQSGYVTDLLLRAGADLVVAADADPHALGNTEATFHEHVREQRSKRRDQLLLTRRCDRLPMPRKHDEDDEISRKLQEAQFSSGTADVDATSATAAERRRRRAREEGRGYTGMRLGAENTADSAAPSLAESRASADGSPFQVVYIHPPASTTVWPVTSAHGGAQASLQSTSWWQSLLRKAADDGVSQQLLLPFLPCDAVPAAGRRSPLATWSGLRHTIEALRGDVTERRPTALPDSVEGGETLAGREPQFSRGSDALLCDDGYVVLVLPRTYDVDLLLREGEQQNSPSLADWVVAQLDGYYDLVLRRRCLAHASASPASAAAQLNAFEEALVTYPRRVQHLEEQSGEDEHGTSQNASSRSAAAVDAAPWKGQLTRLYQKEWWQDVLVFTKNPAMVRRCAAARHNSPSLSPQRLSMMQRGKRKQDGVAWEDSFEYNEYHPRDAAQLTSHHWTDLMPTYSYLEPDFYDEPAAAQLNFLAVGHQPALLRATSASAGYGVPSLQDGGTAKEAAGEDGVASASAQAAVNFQTLFAQELRTRRRSKLRKLALSPLERQEWYIDEKLIKSSGARVELMNQLSKWDLKDYDN
ncbi:putative mitochondrial hypothetical protein [Leptomonas pyrrhocoris]|uniref:Uncharacterized protein n=1 Tax=Leptomonas pyrrhocoris TaxID=157538 RepID=A0A0M9G421_LEPPY|nr:putative mitochondrial hypothetical protein [Leptomonas pyrrhocoris]KPA82000.1 putative mitochondrial hypothetical protein [Leptomonas pyrrhocoris]|eukprot:XP_015660439.1 putative mitochondrial hypothetical protein [Leptomonas pyrrhocoris]